MWLLVLYLCVRALVMLLVWLWLAAVLLVIAVCAVVAWVVEECAVGARRVAFRERRVERELLPLPVRRSVDELPRAVRDVDRD